MRKSRSRWSALREKLRSLGELHQEARVDLERVGAVLDVDRDLVGRAARRLDVDQLAQLRVDRFARLRVALVQPVQLGQLRAHVLVVVVALVLDGLVDIDRIDEPHAAAQIETRDKPEADVITNVGGAAAACPSTC